MRHCAFKIKDLDRSRSFRPGSALYKVGPPAEVNDMGFLTETHFVVVAVTDEAVDHGKPETTIFAATKKGRLFSSKYANAYFEDLAGAYEEMDLLGEGRRIVGKKDHAAALKALGYRIVDDERIVDEVNRAFREKIEQIRRH